MIEKKERRGIGKRGYSFAGWTEVILIGALMIVAIGLIVNGMNAKYGTNNDASFGLGLQDDANSTFDSFKNYQESYQSAVDSGEANFASVFGLTLSTSYDLIKTAVTLLWSVFSGSWITKAVVLMHLPVELGLVFQILYLLSIGYILLQVLFRTIGKP